MREDHFAAITSKPFSPRCWNEAVEIEGERIDLSYALLRRLSLVDANLKGADLNSAKFIDSRIENCQLRSANLSGSEFDGVELWCVDAMRCSADHMEMVGCRVWRCNFISSTMRECSLRNVLFVDCSFARCIITNSNIYHCTGSRLLFHEIVANNTRFSCCEFVVPVFTDSDLTDSRFDRVILEDGVLMDCLLSGCNMAGSDFEGCQIENLVGVPVPKIPSRDLAVGFLEAIEAGTHELFMETWILKDHKNGLCNVCLCGWAAQQDESLSEIHGIQLIGALIWPRARDLFFSSNQEAHRFLINEAKGERDGVES